MSAPDRSPKPAALPCAVEHAHAPGALEQIWQVILESSRSAQGRVQA